MSIWSAATGPTCARSTTTASPAPASSSTIAALAEAGDLVDPIARRVLTPDALIADLPGLWAGIAGRRSDDEITLFKAVGTAVADFVAAIAAWKA